MILSLKNKVQPNYRLKTHLSFLCFSCKPLIVEDSNLNLSLFQRSKKLEQIKINKQRLKREKRERIVILYTHEIEYTRKQF